MQLPSPSASFGAVVALKPAAQAKSRLRELPVPLRERLARAMAVDTLRALADAGAALVVVGADDEMPGMLRRDRVVATLEPEPVPSGMNAALEAGAGVLRSAGIDPVLACVGDLPALTADSIAALLDHFSRLDHADRPDQVGGAGSTDGVRSRRAFVPDRSGVGTTILIATDGELEPRFQNESAASHRSSGAVPIALDGYPELRSDVDTSADLATVIKLGVGARTAQLVDQQRGRVADYTAVTVISSEPTESSLVVSDAGVRMALPADSLDPRIRSVRTGQRLHAAVVGSRLISAWW